MMKKWNLLLSTLLITSMVLVGCGADSSTTANTPASTSGETTVAAEGKDTLIVALQGEPSTLNVQYAEDTNMYWVTWQTNESLVCYDGDTLEIEPELALSWENVDTTTWTFQIRDGVKFHDGSMLTAEDVAFSINRIISEELGSQYAGDFSTIEKAEATGEMEVTITTIGADPILLKRLTKLPIVSKAVTDGKANEELTAQIIGTGPYKFVSWELLQALFLF